MPTGYKDDNGKEITFAEHCRLSEIKAHRKVNIEPKVAAITKKFPKMSTREAQEAASLYYKIRVDQLGGAVGIMCNCHIWKDEIDFASKVSKQNRQALARCAVTLNSPMMVPRENSKEHTKEHTEAFAAELRKIMTPAENREVDAAIKITELSTVPAVPVENNLKDAAQSSCAGGEDAYSKLPCTERLKLIEAEIEKTPGGLEAINEAARAKYQAAEDARNAKPRPTYEDYVASGCQMNSMCRCVLCMGG